MFFSRLGEFFNEHIQIDPENSGVFLQRALIVLAALSFVTISTVTIALEEIFVELNPIASLQVGDVAPAVSAPADVSFTSDVLTDEARQAARDAVAPSYDPPDPDVAQRQTQQAQRILAFIQNVRRDLYATTEQKLSDLNQITALTLTPEIAALILQFDDETWSAIEQEILTVISQVMRNPIRPDNIQNERTLLPNQVGLRFSANERSVIVAVAEDLIRPNSFENPANTEAARDAAEAAVEPIERRFIRGESVVTPGNRITTADYEALQRLGLLQSNDLRLPNIGRAFIASLIVLVMAGLYLSRFTPELMYNEPRMLFLIGGIFLTMLVLIRFLGINGDIYLFPAAAMALLFVAISGPHVAMIASLGLAFLVGIMAKDNLELVILVATGSMMGVLTLRRAERLNAFFFSGLMIGVINVAVIILFGIATPTPSASDLASKIFVSFSSDALLVPAATIAVMYVVSFVFNLTTALKLIDLAQPNKPLLQRLLREAPGTYQHSLQVANLASQAANAIGADAQLTHVAALYHDIGKMLNPIFFTENQTPNMGNPHDTLNDPYRSADIIIGHVTEGDELARQYRLPSRIRDFIREHHGTTQVYVFYKQALAQAGDDETALDIADFTYPGPRPRSRETAILLLADSCEAAVRSEKPASKEEIRAIVEKIFNSKRDQGQLDKSNLTLNDLREIRTIFVDILQGMFHPRINYKEAVNRSKPANTSPVEPAASQTKKREASPKPYTSNSATMTMPAAKANPRETQAVKKATAASRDMPRVPVDYEEEAPLEEVPRLPSADERRSTGNLKKQGGTNGTHQTANGAQGETEKQPDESTDTGKDT